MSHVLHFGDSTFRRSHLLDLLEDNLFQRKQSMIPRAQSQRKSPEVEGLTKNGTVKV